MRSLWKPEGCFPTILKHEFTWCFWKGATHVWLARVVLGAGCECHYILSKLQWGTHTGDRKMLKTSKWKNWWEGEPCLHLGNKIRCKKPSLEQHIASVPLHSNGHWYFQVMGTLYDILPFIQVAMKSAINATGPSWAPWASMWDGHALSKGFTQAVVLHCLLLCNSIMWILATYSPTAVFLTALVHLNHFFPPALLAWLLMSEICKWSTLMSQYRPQVLLKIVHL